MSGSGVFQSSTGVVLMSFRAAKRSRIKCEGLVGG